MRSMTNTLIFEAVLDSVPQGSEHFHLLSSVFSPNVAIVEEDCHTTVGESKKLSLDVLGEILPVTNLPITYSSMIDLLASGQTTRVRSTSSCTSEGGICKKCLTSSRPWLDVDVGDYINFDPMYVIQTENIYGKSGQSSFTISFTSEKYDRVCVYVDGQYLPHTSVAVSGVTVTIPPLVEDAIVTFKFHVKTNSQFFYWLSTTYGGDVLGISTLPHLPLGLRVGLFERILPEHQVEEACSIINRSIEVPTSAKEYLNELPLSLEKAVLAACLVSIFCT